MSNTYNSQLSLPLETVLTTLVTQFDTIAPTELPPTLVTTLTELQTYLREHPQEVRGAATDSTDSYHALLEFMSNAYLVTDLNLKIQEVNDASCRMLMTSEAELLNSQFDMVFPASEKEVLKEKARQVFETNLPSLEWECVIQRRSGELPIVAKLGAVKDIQQRIVGFRWLLRDISRRKQTNARLQRTYKLLLALVEASPKGIVMVDTQGRVQLWSDAAERILGWAQEEVLGQIPNHLSSEIIEQWLISEGRQDEVELTVYRKEGTPVLIRMVTAALHSPEGQIIGWLQIFTDITKQHKMRTELLQMKARLAASREAEQRRLARGLHDDVIQQLIALQMDLANQRRQAEKNPGALIEGELAQTFSRLEAQVVYTVKELRGVLRELRPAGLEEHGLVAALDGFLNQIGRQYAHRELQIEKQWPSTPLHIPLPIATCLFKVAQEALRNVVRHTTAQKVEILLEQSNSHTIMVIRDNGEGFATQPKFTQLAHDGHFGLVGMLERVELVGGQLKVESTPGEGTAIRVSVPLIVEE
jgi:PAS domain S-box-containing protein